MRRRIRMLVILLIIGGAGALLLLPGLANSVTVRNLGLGAVPLSASGPTLTPTICPQATPEAFWVDPVVSPTTYLTQTILVYIGQGDWARVTLETGIYTETGSITLLKLAAVEVDLDSNATHHLTAAAHVPESTWPGGCQYGGYILSASVDKEGNPLTIVQVSRQHYLPVITENQSPPRP